jgi:flagellar hook assembly protein FlgD
LGWFDKDLYPDDPAHIAVENVSVKNPQALSLAGSPNPFTGSAYIRYSMEKPMNVELSLFDARGIKVRTLESGLRQAGVHQAVWDGAFWNGAAAPRGVYVVRLVAGRRELSHRLVRL